MFLVVGVSMINKLRLGVLCGKNYYSCLCHLPALVYDQCVTYRSLSACESFLPIYDYVISYC